MACGCRHRTKLETNGGKDASVIRSVVLKNAVASFFLAIVQIVAGTITHSSGLIADGFHTVSDMFCDFVVFLTSYFSRKEADDDHQYGHYRYENAASFIIGLVLLLAGIGIAGHGIKKILMPTGQVKIEKAALLISVLTIFLKELLFRQMLAVGKQVNSPMLLANAWHARSDAFSSLVVTVGIVGSLAGYPFWDILASVVVGAMICRIGWTFVHESFNDLTDRGASNEIYEETKKIVNSTPGVLGCHDLKTRKMGSMILIDVHIEVDGSITVKEGHDIAVEARKRITERLPVLNVMTHIDPVEIEDKEKNKTP